MPVSAFPARLHVILARRAELGIVVRRGPAKSICTLLWDRRTDTFCMGQWLRGRIYGRRCDLSPDGRYLWGAVLEGRGSPRQRRLLERRWPLHLERRVLAERRLRTCSAPRFQGG